MTTADLMEKARRYPVPIVCGAIVLISFFAYYFRMNLLDDLQNKWNEVERRAVQVDTNLVAGTSLEEHLAAIRTKIGNLEARVVRQSELATNLKYFYQFESETGVSLADLRQNPMPPPGKNDANKAPFVGVGYSVMLSGSFAQIVAYFNELENGARYYRLRNFNLQRGRETNQATVTLALNLELLGWP